MNEVWILAETKAGKVAPVSYELLSWARSLGGPDEVAVTAVLAGPASDPEELCYRGADAVIHGAEPGLAGFSARPLSAWLASLFGLRRPTVLLAAATATGRTVLPYLAASEGLGLTADCTELSLDPESGVLLQTRPAAGGNIMATIRTARGLPQMATVRPHSRKALDRDPSRPVRVERFAAAAGPGGAGGAGGGQGRAGEGSAGDGLVLLGERPFESSRGLADARLVFAGGKGFRKKEGFELLFRLAELAGGEVGASREAVDRGWADYPCQVGLSGRTISPELYLAFGISGAIQHLAGMQTSGFIVSVNSDPDAPIAAASDLAVRADVYELVPALAARLEGYRPAE
ncbi:MAG TPA: electron transfer flavoprotein subunit alpha/FixB family protein [Spirochaetia bacterium]|nr:electron transfer flavoprotein subunit alpha/FixB family protein [Spirochaetia bacterium]